MRISKYTLIVTAAMLQSIVTHAQTGSTSLFDGKTLKGWKHVNSPEIFKVVDGAIVGSAGNNLSGFLLTQKKYGDFLLELDVKTEGGYADIDPHCYVASSGFEIKGTVITGNSVEINPPDSAWTGGIDNYARYGWIYPLSLNPKAKPAFKKSQWNHLKIECIGNSTKTWVNGVPAAYLIDTVRHFGSIGLQVNSISVSENITKTLFKNITIKTADLHATPFPSGIFVVNYQSNKLSEYEKANGWKLLFDGKTSTGWIGANMKTFPTKPDGWIVKDGTMTILGSAGGEAANVGDIVTTKEYSAFDLSFEFRMSTGANSGVKYFVTLNEDTKGSAIGLEYQVLDDLVHPDAKLGRNGDRTLSSLYDLIPANKPAAFIRPIGAWNTGRIIVYPNNHVEHYLNGVKVLEYERGSKEFRDLVAISKYVVWKNFGEAKQGHILLQDHGFTVNYRSIKLKELDR